MRQAPDAELLQEFLGRLPIIFNVAILSPHGFFGQKDVLGKPDTGGQVHIPPCLPTYPNSIRPGSYTLPVTLLKLLKEGRYVI